MASEDIIELGSSDEEMQPTPKKMKPVPNAMVHIPNNLHGVTIKPTKAKPTSSTKGQTGKPILKPTIVHKVPTLIANTHLIRNKINGKALQTPVIKQTFRIQQKAPTVVRTVANPMNFIKLGNTQPFINKVPASFAKTAIRVQNPKALKKLPPSITVTRTSTNLKRINSDNIPNMCKKPKLLPGNTIGEVLTVELDDDETPRPSSTASPQWYLRPEEQKFVKTKELKKESEELQERNNKEPKPPKFIEITIEDSPVKSAQNKRTHEIGAELAITIDDSPIKGVTDKNVPASSSDDEINPPTKVPHSKKKLEYPKKAEVTAATSVEIEIDPMPVDQLDKVYVDEDKNKEMGEVSIVLNNIMEVGETASEPVDNVCTSTPMESNPVQYQLKTKEIGNVSQSNKDCGEFHPIYRSFIDLCFKLENSDDMSKIVEKKIKNYYRQVPKEYTESEEFLDMVSSKIMSMKAGPEKMYLYIKDIVDELNLQRKMPKSLALNTDKSAEPEKFVFGEDSEYDSKRQRQIRKLEKTLRKLHRAIQKLEEQEVDFDDEEDSVYLLTERYKERLVRVHAKFCQLTNTKMPSEPRVQIDARPGQPTGPAKRLELWINRKVPIGTLLPFPDFHDVLRCVKESNQEDKLGWNDVDIMEEARDLFMRCGRKLQRRRQENEWRLAASRISADLDPAESSEDLKRKLEENKRLATKKETEVLNKYADRQNLLKLEAVEIGDREADESPVESEDDEINDEGTSLENSEKRKERLKRLLQEKAKKVDAEKENQPNIERAEGENDSEIATVDTKEDVKTVMETDEANKADMKGKFSQTASKQSVSHENKENPNDNEKALSVSDDSNMVESDIDELHLLQKLHSDNEMNTSTLDSSDTDTPIAISDTLSSSDNRKRSSDVISIENSSYSESENNKNSEDRQNVEIVCLPSKGVIKEIVNDKVEIECSSAGIKKKHNKTNNDEYNESVEDILLASSDEEGDSSRDKTQKGDETNVNLKDDPVSIDAIRIEKEIQKDARSLVEAETVNKMHNVNSVSEMFDKNTVENLERDTNTPANVIGVEPVKTMADNLPNSIDYVLQNDFQLKDDNVISLSSVDLKENTDTSGPNKSVAEEILGSSSESNEANVKVNTPETVTV